MFPDATIVALDADEGAWKRAKEKFDGLTCDVRFINANFRDLGRIADFTPDGVIFDLGLSSDQLNPPAGGSWRGFSFIRNEPLLMTMKENPSPEDLTARDIVNTWSEASLVDIIRGYGEERYAKRIAQAIVAARTEKEIATTFDLVKIIEEAVPRSYGGRGKIHPATRTFQAIRIAVNDELGALAQGLAAGFAVLGPGGRMAVISFHSLEDRIVKRFFRDKKAKGEAVIINKKPIVPGADELQNNPRSRSAKLRIAEKTLP